MLARLQCCLVVQLRRRIKRLLLWSPCGRHYGCHRGRHYEWRQCPNGKVSNGCEWRHLYAASPDTARACSPRAVAPAAPHMVHPSIQACTRLAASWLLPLECFLMGGLTTCSKRPLLAAATSKWKTQCMARSC